MHSVLLRAILIIAALCTSSLGADTKPAGSASQDSSALKVMSFNIRNSAARDGENHWSKRQELVTSAIRAFDPDLLGVQEVLADQYDALVKTFGDYSAVGVARDDGARKGEWSAILYKQSRFEKLDSGDFWLSETPDKVGSVGWDAAYTRICTWAKLRDRITKREFLFANTHFDHKGKLARVNSALLLRERLPQIAGGVPVILAGDFNCTEESEPYKTLAAPLTSAALPEKKHLLDSYRIVHPERTDSEATFHAFKGTVQGSRIDWILHSKDLKPVAAEIVRSNEAGRYPSDHYPVTAVFVWR